MAEKFPTLIESLNNWFQGIVDEAKEKKKPKVDPSAKGAAPVAPKAWEVTLRPCFAPSLAEKLSQFPDLREKLSDFKANKIQDPITRKYGKHDGRMKPPFESFLHCHLRDDAILIYDLKGREIRLFYIANHSEIEGKRQYRTAGKITPYL